jgi:hypothetical protein
MPTYRIHRMKDAPRQQFRFAPHVSGAATARPKDYETDGEVDAATEYDAWAKLRDSQRPLEVGDLLETAAGELRIFKYVGFEAANWHVPEHKPPAEELPAATPPVSAQPAQA